VQPLAVRLKVSTLIIETTGYYYDTAGELVLSESVVAVCDDDALRSQICRIFTNRP